MFAILGLRALYPILSKAATDLKYLEPAVAIILAFIGYVFECSFPCCIYNDFMSYR